jgi:septal ring factor EnvC (AmiA/AmiB activator)
MKADEVEKMLHLIKKLPKEDALEEAINLLEEIVSEKKKRAETCKRKNKKGSTKKETSETTTRTTEVKEKTEFDKAIDGFIEMRKKIKKPLTEQ